MVKYCNKRYYKILIIYDFKQGVTQPEYFGHIIQIMKNQMQIPLLCVLNANVTILLLLSSLHTLFSTQSLSLTLLSSLIARCWVEAQTQ